MKYNNGDEVAIGDVIRWRFYPSDFYPGDDWTFWIFTGLVKSTGVVYLGGGIDFGMTIGELMSYEEVQGPTSYTYENMIEKVGVASELAWHIEKFGV